MYKLEKELELIKDNGIKEFTREVLNNLPEYFWTIPASSTEKYHPKHALDEGGLVRHTQCAVRIAHSLFTISDFSELKQDMILSAITLHDGLKKGLTENKHTKHEHPVLMSIFIRKHALTENARKLISVSTLDSIAGCIASHMGQWSKVKYSQIILPTPSTSMEKFVHMCDYLASRKFLNMDLED